MQTFFHEKKQLLLIGSGIVIFSLFVFGLVQLANQDEQAKKSIVEATDQDTKILGNPNARVTLLEYSDFQCPACAAYEPFIKELHEAFPDTLKIVFRHFPLPMHKNAVKAAAAAEAAHQQGKFWEISERLFQHQKDWSNLSNPDDTFKQYARDLGLDETQFANDLQSEATKQALAADQKLGKTANIPGTPTFFLNGTQIKDIKSFEDLKSRVQSAIEQAQ